MLNRLTSIALLTTMTTAYADTKAQPLRKLPPAPAPFAAQLDGELATQKGNFLYSPASIEIALAMTREGARGDTATEMDRILGPNASAIAKQLTKTFKTAKQQPGQPTPPELAIANRLFGDTTTKFEQPFLDVTSKDYEAPVEALDFRTHWDAARVHINTWVAHQTHDKIKNLIPPPAIDASTRMVLVNAIYMKASWATPFEPGLTAPAPFAIDGSSSKKVSTMHMEGGASWGDHAGARMLDLPYYSAGGPRLGMLLVVPDGSHLDAVEAAYAKEGIAPFLAAVKTTGRARVALPKFEVGTSFELSTTLAKLGMKTPFSDAADFSGMSKLATHISSVVHKAWAKVDENGTEAAAATAVMMAETSVAVPAAKKFDVDRSFLFFIHDENGDVLFAGRIVDPSAA
jgi:serpin B